MPGDHAIAIELLRFEPEIGRAMDDEAVQFDERAFVQKKLESLPGRQLSLLVLRLETRLTTTQLGLGAPALQEVELLTHRHWSEKLTLCGIGI